MLAFLFGKKRRSSKKTAKTLPKALVKLAKKYRVKVTVKRGSKKVYKSVSVIKKQIKMKMKSKRRKSPRSRRRRRTMRFGFGSNPGQFIKHQDKFGYGEEVNQINGVDYGSSQVVDGTRSNNSRPDRLEAGKGNYESMRLGKREVPVYGVGKTFFDSTVPGTIPPNHMFMGQPDGSMVALGSPFAAYKKAGFGKRRAKMNVPDRFSGVLSGAKGMSVSFKTSDGKKVSKKLKKMKNKKFYTFMVKGRLSGRIFKVAGPLKKGKKVKVVLFKRLK